LALNLLYESSFCYVLPAGVGHVAGMSLYVINIVNCVSSHKILWYCDRLLYLAVVNIRSLAKTRFL